MPKLTGKRGIAAYLRARVGQVVHNSELYEASGRQSEYTRRIRELRRENGWDIQTHFDVEDLKQDEYRLASLPPEDPPIQFKRGVSQRVRAQALARNGFTCQMCGAAPGDVDERGRKVRLHADHIVNKSEGGTDGLSNLRTLCSQCNEGAKDIVTAPESQIWLLGRVRTANSDDQRAVYNWLRRKFDEPRREPKDEVPE